MHSCINGVLEVYRHAIIMYHVLRFPHASSIPQYRNKVETTQSYVSLTCKCVLQQELCTISAMHKESPGTASTGLRGLSPLCDSYCHEANQLKVPLTSTNHCTRRQLSRNMVEPYPSGVGRSVGHSTGNVKGMLTKSSGHVLTTSTPLPRCASASTPSASPRPTSSPSLLVTSCHVVSRVPQALRRSLRRTTAVVAPCSSRATPASDAST